MTGESMETRGCRKMRTKSMGYFFSFPSRRRQSVFSRFFPQGRQQFSGRCLQRFVCTVVDYILKIRQGFLLLPYGVIAHTPIEDAFININLSRKSYTKNTADVPQSQYPTKNEETRKPMICTGFRVLFSCQKVRDLFPLYNGTHFLNSFV